MKKVIAAAVCLMATLVLAAEPDSMPKGLSWGQVSDIAKVQDQPLTQPHFSIRGDGNALGFYTDDKTAYTDLKGGKLDVSKLHLMAIVRVEYERPPGQFAVARKVTIAAVAPPTPVAPKGQHFCLEHCECGCAKGPCFCSGKECEVEGLIFDNGMFEPSTGTMMFPVPVNPQTDRVKAVPDRNATVRAAKEAKP